MTVSPAVPMTLADFEAWVELPENADKVFEWVAGEVVEKMPSNMIASRIASRIIFYLELFLQQRGLKGHVTGADGGYQIGGERYVPDVALVALAKLPQLAPYAYCPVPPDLAVEVVSDPQSGRERRDLRRKVMHYVAAGVTVWVVDPFDYTVEVYRPDHPFKLVELDGTLTGEGLLAGFALPLRQLFPDAPSEGEHHENPVTDA